jgi:hypothetical protein
MGYIVFIILFIKSILQSKRQIHLGISVLCFHFPPTIAVDGKRAVAAATPVAAASPNTTGAEKEDKY